MEENTADWEISKLYSQAWGIIKKYKLLWVLGVATAGSMSFNPSGLSNAFNHPANQNNLPQKTSQVLGAATSSPFSTSIQAIFAHIPLSFYLFLGTELLILALIGIVISVVYSSWAQGMLIQATSEAADDKKLDLGELSQKILPKLKSLVWLRVVPILIFLLSSMLFIFVLPLAITFTPMPLKLIPIFLLIIAVGAVIYWLIFINMALIWAPRQVLDAGKPAKEAFFSGLKVSRKKFWSTLLLGIVNNILAGFVSIALIFAVIVIVLILGVIGVILAKASTSLLIPLIILGIVIAIPLVILLTLFGGITNSFKAVVWTLAYKQIKGKYD